jgi:hypothetical protein
MLKASEGKPIIITEYGADTYPGLHSVVEGNPWSEEYQIDRKACRGRRAFVARSSTSSNSCGSRGGESGRANQRQSQGTLRR